MAFAKNPTTGEIVIVDDTSGPLSAGWTIPSDKEVDEYAKKLDFDTAGQQTQAQLERVARGATLGAVQGFGGDEGDIQARADVSREEHPIVSLAADVAPDVAVSALTAGVGGLASGAGRLAARTALAEGGGLLRAGLAAGRAGGVAALAGESVGAGLVGAGQQAFEEGRYLGQDLGQDAENALLWGGLNFAIGGIGLARAARAEGKGAAKMADAELEDVAKAAELEASQKLPEGMGSPSAAADEAAPSPAFQEGMDKLKARQDQSGYAVLGRNSELPTDPGERKKAVNLMYKRVENLPSRDIMDLPAQGERDYPNHILKDKKTILDKPEQQAINDYVGEDYRHIRASLSGDAGEDGLHPSSEFIEPALAKLNIDNPTQHGHLYRGMGLDDDALNEALLKGEFNTSSITSASYNPHEAMSFAVANAKKEVQPNAVVVQFEHVDKGSPINLHEREVLIPKGGHFVVTGREHLGDGVLLLKVKQAGQASADQMKQLGALGSVDASSLLTGPMGNVVAGAAGAAIGNQIDGGEGAIAGGVMGLGASLLMGRRGIAAATRQAEKAAVDDGFERALRKASAGEAEDIVQKATRGAEPVAEADSFGRQRRLYQNRDAILDVSVREMQQDLTKVVKDVSQLAGPGKLDDVVQHVGDNIGAQRQVAYGISKDAANFAGQLRGEARAYAEGAGKKGLAFQVPGSKALVGALMDHAEEIQKAGTGKEMFSALNRFKQVADDIKLSMENGAANSVDPLGHQKLIPRVQDFAAKIRAALEDSSTWGKAGAMQGEYNAVIHDQLLPSMRVFEQSVLEKSHKGYDAMWQSKGWESKIKSLLQGADPGKQRHVGAVLDAMDQLASVRSKYGGAAEGKAISDQVAKIKRTMGLADEVADATDRMKAVGAVAGMVPGAPKQWLMGDLQKNFQKLMGATDEAVGRSVDDWITSSRVRGRGGVASKVAGFAGKVLSGADDSQLAQVARRRGVSHGMALFMGEDDNATAAFEKKRTVLLDDEKFFETMGQDYKSLQEQAPEAYMMLSAQATKARKLLLDRMPSNVSVSMTRPNGYPPSREAIEDWAVYWNAVQDPMRVVKNLPAARIQEIETLKTVYPRMHEKLQQTVIEKIGAAQAAGEPLDDSALMRLDLLFTMDGAASPAFSMKAARMVREYNEAQQSGAPAAPSGKAPAPAPMGPLQATAQKGVTFGVGY